MDMLQHLVLMGAVTLLSAILMLLVALLSGFGDSILGVLAGSRSWLGRLRHFGTPFLTNEQHEGGQRWRQCSCKWLESTGGMYLTS